MGEEGAGDTQTRSRIMEAFACRCARLLGPITAQSHSLLQESALLEARFSVSYPTGHEVHESPPTVYGLQPPKLQEPCSQSRQA